MNELLNMSVSELAQALHGGSLSSTEITRAYLEQIRSKDAEIGAYLLVDEEKALQEAAEADARLKQGDDSVLLGIPMGLKDNLCTKGMRTTCASKILGDFIPPYTATAVAKLRQAGAVTLGKLNMDEFAMGSSTENSAFQVTRNPRRTDCVPGGSSGGSAAAVAALEAAFTLGSDTGGSIRQPASFCGVVGMKPTYGGVSRYGLIAFASSLDQIGPVTKTVRDSALIMNVITGRDAKDSTSVAYPYDDFTAGLEDGVKGMKLALPEEFLGEGIADDVREMILKAAELYRSMGASVETISLPALKNALPAYYVISSAEASSNLARFDGIRYGFRAEDYEDISDLYKNSRSQGFGAEVKRRIMLGTFALSSGYYDAYYKKALQVRTLISRAFSAAFEKYDLILSPVAPTAAYRIGEKTASPTEMYMGDICTVPVNIAGLPPLALPFEVTKDGRPLGFQLIGPAFGEKTIYRAAAAFEKEEGKC